jgi:hypothetical protein
MKRAIIYMVLVLSGVGFGTVLTPVVEPLSVDTNYYFTRNSTAVDESVQPFASSAT